MDIHPQAELKGDKWKLFVLKRKRGNCSLSTILKIISRDSTSEQLLTHVHWNFFS